MDRLNSVIKGDMPNVRINFANAHRADLLKKKRESIKQTEKNLNNYLNGNYYEKMKPNASSIGAYLRPSFNALQSSTPITNSIKSGGCKCDGYGRVNNSIFQKALNQRKEFYETQRQLKDGLNVVKEEAEPSLVKSDKKKELVKLEQLISELETEIKDGQWEDIDLKDVRAIYNEIKKNGYNAETEELYGHYIRLLVITGFRERLQALSKQLFKESIYNSVLKSILLLMVFIGTQNQPLADRKVIVNEENKKINKTKNIDDFTQLFESFREKYNIRTVENEVDPMVREIDIDAREKRDVSKLKEGTKKKRVAESAIEAEQIIENEVDRYNRMKDRLSRDQILDLIDNISAQLNVKGVNKKLAIDVNLNDDADLNPENIDFEDLPNRFAMKILNDMHREHQEADDANEEELMMQFRDQVQTFYNLGYVGNDDEVEHDGAVFPIEAVINQVGDDLDEQRQNDRNEALEQLRVLLEEYYNADDNEEEADVMTELLETTRQMYLEGKVDKADVLERGVSVGQLLRRRERARGDDEDDEDEEFNEFFGIERLRNLRNKQQCENLLHEKITDRCRNLNDLFNNGSFDDVECLIDYIDFGKDRQFTTGRSRLKMFKNMRSTSIVDEIYERLQDRMQEMNEADEF